MKQFRHLLAATLSAILLQLCVPEGKTAPVLGRTTFVVEIGSADYGSRGLGEGTYYRVSFYKKFLDYFEWGPGLTFYQTKDFNYPHRSQSLPDYQVNELSDYNPALSLRVNLPIHPIWRAYLGSRVGVHFVEWSYVQPYEAIIDSEDFTAFGLDVYIGTKFGSSSFPLGLQGEVGVTHISEKLDDQSPRGLYFGAGVYLEFN
ncbi:MAG: hypothetical protein L0Y74_05165 [candidate division Zixibacteria bacterium]|nr:hypothetical protein [candidate division Zixibacteria bacterium]